MQNIFSYISNIDTSVLYAIQSIGPEWKGVAWVLSYAVSYEAMIIAFVIALFLLRRHRVAFELIAITIVSLGVTYILKKLFHMPRPFTIDPNVIQYDTDGGYGMPSAHALMSVVILGWVALRHPKSHILVWGSLSLIVLIGWSRVFLGVHYPSQVIAGWIFGALFLYIFHKIDRRLWAPFSKKLK